MILVGDIGGTHVRLTFARIRNGKVWLDAVKTYSSQSCGGLEQVLQRFLQGSPGDIWTACFGVPGPVEGNRCSTTNLPWAIDGEELVGRLGFDSVLLLNDLEATAHGILTLQPTDLLVLNAGRQSAIGNKVVIAAGTGLGEAGACWDGAQYLPFATEGGHTDFGPRTDQEWRLSQFLQARFGRVSVERVISGPGIESMFHFLHHEAGSQLPDWFKALGKDRDASAAITRRALDGSDQSCVQTLDWFASLYGSEAGNLALKLMGRGGVYVAGGIAPKVLDPRHQRIFIEAFFAKGRMRPVLESVPVYIVLEEACPLFGAASFAGRTRNLAQRGISAR